MGNPETSRDGGKWKINGKCQGVRFRRCHEIVSEDEQ